MMVGWYKIACLLFSLCGLVACKSKNAKPQDTLFSGVVPVAVDETLSPFVQEELDVFEASYPLADIIPNYTNEVEAMNLLLRDSVRFVVATRPLTADELDSFHSRKFFPKSIKIAVDGIALIVHKENPDSILSVAGLQAIFSGEVTRWKELIPGSKGDTIRVVYDHSNSSTVRYVVDSICRGGRLSPRSYGAGTNRAVIEYVARTRDALGVIGVNWISEEHDSLSREFRSEIQVVRVSRSTEPTYQNSYQPYQYYLNSGDYPFTRDIYINLNDPRSGLPSGLTNFITSSRGQRIILKAGLLPATMPVNVVHIKNE
ncbi:MAG: substrate-binding domain-containing protein [Odoribacteraceae bacterium]|jgi:phosphate transport system substrate-binding protein|nr:substrate-binding domain-containing protein [Odoribacteraceae bacterium]